VKDAWQRFGSACADLNLATAGVVAAIYAVNYMIQKRKKEKYRAEELAKVVLKRLQDQVSG
jgi:uncharacterized metal-binding protein